MGRLTSLVLAHWMLVSALFPHLGKKQNTFKYSERFPLGKNCPHTDPLAVEDTGMQHQAFSSWKELLPSYEYSQQTASKCPLLQGPPQLLPRLETKQKPSHLGLTRVSLIGNLSLQSSTLIGKGFLRFTSQYFDERTFFSAQSHTEPLSLAGIDF